MLNQDRSCIVYEIFGQSKKLRGETRRKYNTIDRNRDEDMKHKITLSLPKRYLSKMS